MSASSAPASPGDVLRARQDALAEDIVTRHFAAHPDLDRRYGPAGRTKCRQDAVYHLSYLAEAMNTGAPTLFSNYIAWARVMLASRGIPLEDLATQLDVMTAAIREGIGGAPSALAVEYLGGAIDRLQSLPATLPPCIVPDAPHGAMARRYLEALLRGERHVASRLVLDAAAGGMPVRDIYLHVFQPAHYEIGRLWQLNEISVGQEHYCTAATQLVMSQLYPQVFSSEKGGGTLVATCVSGDLHEIGARMVADFLEMDGWHTFYLGASTPAESVVGTVVERRAGVLGISATIANHLGAVRDLIQRVRATPECAGVKILVGGYPFVMVPELWRTVGADATAPDAQRAAELARRLVS